MASGNTHDFLNLATLPIFLYGVPHEYFLYFGSAYMISTILLSPDIDLHHSKPSKRWKMLKWLWHPYRIVFKHRGLSHFPIVGTLSRLLYVFALVVFLYFVIVGIMSFSHYSHTFIKSSDTFFQHIKYRIKEEDIFWFVMGAVVSDIVHIFWDFVFSFLKKLKKFIK
jgi:uncharacterized metal-binding protein